MPSEAGRARGVVVQRTSGFADVRVDGEVVRCRVRGRLKKGSFDSDVVVVGDDVELRLGPGEALLDLVLPRRTQLARRHPTKARVVEDVLAANVDVALVCLARGSTGLRPRVLDRFLAVAALGRVPAWLVITKCDLTPAPDEAAWVDAYARAGIGIHRVAATTGLGLDALASVLAGRRVVLVGPSGSGKSRLANALVPGLDAAVGEVDESTGRGRHTTRLARLVVGPDGLELVDTPGVRELSTLGLEGHDPGIAFPEIADVAVGCRFRDCRHDGVPGCAVPAALAEGTVSDVRYAGYLAMLRGEVESDD